MATHRSQDPAFAPDFEFQVALGVWEASEDLAARRQPITPDTLARQLCARPAGVCPTVTQIQDALAQVQRWRQQDLLCEVFQRRNHLAALAAQVQVQQRKLNRDLWYLHRTIDAAEALLRNGLTPSGGAEPPPARPGARARRALQ